MNDTLYNPQPSVKIVVPWHSEIQLQKFLSAWRTSVDDKRFIFKQDKEKQGCARTKNAGIKDAIEQKMEVVIILDDDCFPEAGQESFVFDLLICSYRAIWRLFNLSRWSFSRQLQTLLVGGLLTILGV